MLIFSFLQVLQTQLDLSEFSNDYFYLTFIFIWIPRAYIFDEKKKYIYIYIKIYVLCFNAVF